MNKYTIDNIKQSNWKERILNSLTKCSILIVPSKYLSGKNTEDVEKCFEQK